MRCVRGCQRSNSKAYTEGGLLWMPRRGSSALRQVRFVNMIINDSTYAIDEAMTALTEISSVREIDYS